jgi:hypothetical protein
LAVLVVAGLLWIGSILGIGVLALAYGFLISETARAAAGVAMFLGLLLLWARDVVKRRGWKGLFIRIGLALSLPAALFIYAILN